MGAAPVDAHPESGLQHLGTLIPRSLARVQHCPLERTTDSTLAFERETGGHLDTDPSSTGFRPERAPVCPGER